MHTFKEKLREPKEYEVLFFAGKRATFLLRHRLYLCVVESPVGDADASCAPTYTLVWLRDEHSLDGISGPLRRTYELESKLLNILSGILGYDVKYVLSELGFLTGVSEENVFNVMNMSYNFYGIKSQERYKVRKVNALV